MAQDIGGKVQFPIQDKKYILHLSVPREIHTNQTGKIFTQNLPFYEQRLWYVCQYRNMHESKALRNSTFSKLWKT